MTGKRFLEYMRSDAIQTVVFCFAFAIFCAWTSLDKINLNSIPPDVLALDKEAVGTQVRIVVCAILAVKMLIQTSSIRDIAFAAVVIALGYVTWQVSQHSAFFMTCMFVAAGKSVRLKPLAIIASICFCSAIVAAYQGVQAGIIENASIGEGDEIRYAWGFVHPNTFGLMMASAAISLAVATPRKAQIIRYPILLGAAFAIYQACGNRTYMLALCASALCFAAVWLVNRMKDHHAKGWRAVTYVALTAAFLGCVAVAVFSYYFMVCFDTSNPTHMSINYMLSGRLMLANQYFTTYGITPFGLDFSTAPVIKLDEDSKSKLLLDNCYCRLLIRYGLVATVAWWTGVVAVFVKAFREQHFGLALAAFLGCVIYGIGESVTIVFGFNYFMILFSATMYGVPFTERRPIWPRAEHRRA